MARQQCCKFSPNVKFGIKNSVKYSFWGKKRCKIFSISSLLIFNTFTSYILILHVICATWKHIRSFCSTVVPQPCKKYLIFQLILTRKFENRNQIPKLWQKVDTPILQFGRVKIWETMKETKRLRSEDILNRFVFFLHSMKIHYLT